MQVRFRTKAHQ